MYLKDQVELGLDRSIQVSCVRFGLFLSNGRKSRPKISWPQNLGIVSCRLVKRLAPFLSGVARRSKCFRKHFRDERKYTSRSKKSIFFEDDVLHFKRLAYFERKILSLSFTFLLLFETPKMGLTKSSKQKRMRLFYTQKSLLKQIWVEFPTLKLWRAIVLMLFYTANENVPT